MLVFFQRNGAGEDDSIHWEGIRAEVGVKEMDREDEANGQQGLVAVNDHGHIDQPSGKYACEELGEPEDQAGKTDHGNPLEHGKVVKFFPVGPAAVFRARAAVQEPFDGPPEIFQVLFVEHQGVFAEDKAAPSCPVFYLLTDK